MSMVLKRALLALLMCTFIYPLALRADSAKYKSMQKSSNSLYKAGKFEQSLALSRKLHVMARDEFGDEHIETAMQNFGIGFNLIKLNRHAEAIPYYQKHLAIKEKVYGKNAIGLQFPLNHLAGAISTFGQAGQGLERHYQRVEKIQTRVALDAAQVLLQEQKAIWPPSVSSVANGAKRWTIIAKVRGFTPVRSKRAGVCALPLLTN